MRFEQEVKKLKLETEINRKLLTALMKNLEVDYDILGDTENYQVAIHDTSDK